jgi:hypothetical protein
MGGGRLMGVFDVVFSLLFIGIVFFVVFCALFELFLFSISYS